jgi:hypothetical protein
MKQYTLKYQIENYGDSIRLLSVAPESSYVEDCFYEGKVLTNIYLEDNGVFEFKVVHIFDEDTDYFGIVSLEKLYGEAIDKN